MRELRQAAYAGEFHLCLQPRRLLACGSLCGAEATIRWPRRKLAHTPSGSLLPLLEQCGVMPQTATWMLQAACREAVSWPISEPGSDRSHFTLSVDVPASMLCDGSLGSVVATILAASGLAPGQLDIEVPENEADAAPEAMLLALAGLRDLGTGAALDHFGSISAGLLTLKRLPFTMLKLDRALIRDLPDDVEAAAAVQAAISYAHALDMSVVAIGVDTETQRQALLRLGCDQGQGALFGVPLTPEQFPTLFRAANQAGTWAPLMPGG